MDPIRVLIVEDSDDDAVLIVRRFHSAGVPIEHERAETAAQVAEALDARRPDVVISDYNVPGFGAEAALQLLHDAGIDGDLPFIVVSGEVGEETAAALMKAGAHDVVLKDRLARLVPAVQRELREAADRRQHRLAEDALRRSEERFRMLAEHAQDIIFRCRLVPELALEYISPAVRGILGYEPDQLYADPGILYSAMCDNGMERVLATWRDPEPERLTVQWRRPDGRFAWTEQRVVRITDDVGTPVAVEGILRDVTEAVLAEQERERLERQLRQTERLESLGQLAGGIAHDFNNLLAVITGYSEMIDDSMAPDDPARDDLDGIRAAARRGAGLTRQLLIFSRREPSRPERVDLNEVVRATHILLQRTLGEDIEVALDLHADLRPVVIDASKLEQVVMNLVVNSRAAMPDGGRLSFTSGLVRNVDDPRPPPPDEGGLVYLTVADTGCGMPADVAQHAFEPFFTTRGPGEGSGLGLATAYGAVREAGGEIRLDTAPDRGTAVTIYLPAAAGAAAPTAPARPPAPDGVPGGDERILVVEDEDAVRELVRRTLERSGYRVAVAAAPIEALRLFDARPQDVDAVVADVVMPGMSGTAMAAKMLEQRPELPVLFVSGYTMGQAPGGYALPDGAPLLRKPFEADALLRKLRGLLRGTRQG
ncbi:hybrid sensor histidine kinase/response regulator [Pilimelia anulata]|uniref:hybrid sensor histidine kinase/response regulator n=1 Tax=Pilimelia anulata TaxID=53371 RepID=UPI001E364172|nr:response regulator [Pilimelia anulata]